MSLEGTGGNLALVEDQVADPVADEDEDDPARLRAKVKELESHIGRQNTLHGQKMDQIRDELRQFKEEQAEAIREAQRREQEAYWASLSPAQKMVKRQEHLESEVQSLRAERDQAERRAQERDLIQDILRQAKEDGLDVDQIDTSDYTRALLSYRALENESIKADLKGWKAAQARERAQLKEDVADTVAAVSGRRMVVTGSPSSSAEGARLPKDIGLLMEQYQEARRRKDGPTIIRLKDQLTKAGYWAP